MRCQQCGHGNPEGSVYCQGCGARIAQASVHAAPALGPVASSLNSQAAQSQAAAPGGHVAAVGGAPAPGSMVPVGGGAAPSTGPTCSSCGSLNPADMRFCTECGTPLAAAVVAGQVPVPLNPVAASGASLPADPPAAPQPAPVCWRCRGVGDAETLFCKFCGARYADAPGAQSSAAPAHQEPASQAAASAGHAMPGRPAAETSPAATQQSAAIEARPRAQLVAVLKDGSDGNNYPVRGDQADVGRLEGEILLPDDPYLSPRHARIVRRDGIYILRDLDSVNGIYLRIREAVELRDGDMLLIGQQVIRFETLPDAERPLGPASLQGVIIFGTPEVPRSARLVQYTTEGVGRDVHYLYRDETVLGRENGDIVFTDDPFLSRRHAAITIDRAKGRYIFRDLGSSNGSAVRFRGERVLADGDQFRIGRHLFRFDVEMGADGGVA